MGKLILPLLLVAFAGNALARGDIETLARTCNGCHGVGGVSVSAPMPSIGGLPREYLRRVMKQWKYGERSAITMDRILKGFSDDQIDDLATFFSKQRWVPTPQPVADTVLVNGRKLVAESCQDCHGKTGNDPDVDAPPINGQWAQYMELEMMKYRSNDFKMTHRKMKQAARDIKAADVALAARYYGAQK
jgi:sulfide dehydrogenase cytochrome subunit